MAQHQEVEDLSGEGVAPPCHLYSYPSFDVQVVRACVRCPSAVSAHECVHGVFDAGRSSPIGNPFADNGQQHDSMLHAYDDWLAIVIWLGCTGQLGGSAGVTALIARRHGVLLRVASPVADMRAAWNWLCHVAQSQGTVRLRGTQRDAVQGRQGYTPAISSAMGAISWLRSFMRRSGALSVSVPNKAGDWLVSDIYTRWPVIIATELAAFSWPITSVHELRAFIACSNASPLAIVAFEFTASVRGAYEHHWHFARVALSVDLRSSLVPGPHARLDVRSVLSMKKWQDAFLHPPCTHQVRSDASSLRCKHVDGRTFWGIALFIYCLCVDSDRVVVEQPDTVISDFYTHPSQCIRPCDVGDDDNKPIHLYERGGRLLISRTVGAVGVASHKRIRDFSDADSRDRWRSSWARFPSLSAALVAAVDENAAPAGPLDYREEIERFAVSWHEAGLPVPSDYAAPDAQPVHEADRMYQSRRGRGDGRRVPGALPASRRERIAPVVPLLEMGPPRPLPSARLA